MQVFSGFTGCFSLLLPLIVVATSWGAQGSPHVGLSGLEFAVCSYSLQALEHGLSSGVTWA